MKPVYLDYNATTPIDERVAEAMLPFLRADFGNPSSGHVYGRRARAAVEHARSQVARMMGCDARGVIFTSGGSEANNMAICGAASRSPGSHVVTSAVEHPATIEPCRVVERHGGSLTVVPVDEFGRVDPRDVAEAIRDETVLVTIMHANNEVGTVQPIREIARIARERSVPVHTDAAQSAGKIAVTLPDLGVSAVSLAGHKLYAPKGVGALVVAEGFAPAPLIHGAGHEGGRRAGTENVPAIVGFGVACEIAADEWRDRGRHMAMTRDRLWARIRSGVPTATRLGPETEVLPNTLSVSFWGVDSRTLLERLDPEVAASAGSACHDGDETVSGVLAAMGVPFEVARGVIRLTTGSMTTRAEIDAAADAILREVSALSNVTR